MISSVTVTKFDTVRIVAVGVCAFPVELKAHSKAALSRDFLIKYLIVPSLGISDQLAWFVVVWVALSSCHRRDSHVRSLHRSCLIAGPGTMGTRPCRHAATTATPRPA